MERFIKRGYISLTMDSSSYATGYGNDWKSSARESLGRAILAPESKSVLAQIMKADNFRYCII